MTPANAFHYEVENSGDDQHGNKLTTIKCHGPLVAGNSQLSELVKPMIPLGGRIVIDLADVSYLDSAGLGTLVGLKASAIKQGFCRVELANITPRITELLRITNLLQLFSSPQ